MRAASGKIKLPDAYTVTLRRLDLQTSASAAAAQGKKNEPRDDGDANDHPVLEVDSQNGKVLDQKMQRPGAPVLPRSISISASEIYYFYTSFIWPAKSKETDHQPAAMSSKRA